MTAKCRLRFIPEPLAKTMLGEAPRRYQSTRGSGTGDVQALRYAFLSSASRSSRRRILPTLVVGRLSRNSTSLGRL